MLVVPSKKHKRLIEERDSKIRFLESQVIHYQSELDRSIENCKQLERSLVVTNSKLGVARSTISNKNLEISNLKEEVRSLTYKEIGRLEALIIRTNKNKIKKKCRGRILDHIERMLKLE